MLPHPGDFFALITRRTICTFHSLIPWYSLRLSLAIRSSHAIAIFLKKPFGETFFGLR